MAAIINTNIQSLNAQRNLSSSQSQLATSMQRLSSGLRINSAKDDAAGLAISERMTTQVRGLTVAMRNANDGISLAQTAEGALGTLGSNLQRIRELAVQARNATNSAEDRAALDQEVQQLKAEVTRIAQQTSFNGTNLLDGSFTNMAFQVGANQGQTIDVNAIVNANLNKLGEWESVDIPAQVKGGSAKPAVLGSPIASVTQFELLNPTGSGSNWNLAAFSLTINGTSAGTVGPVNGAATPEDARQQMAAAMQTALDGVITPAGTTKVWVGSDGSLQIDNFSQNPVVLSNGAAAKTLPPGREANGTEFASLDPGFKLNGVEIKLPSAANERDRMADLMTAINGATYPTGHAPVTARMDQGRLVLSAASGDISIVTGSANGLADSSDVLAATGLSAGNTSTPPLIDGSRGYKAGGQEEGFASLSVLDEATADNAILAMDAALKAVNGARATLGAVQSRFETTVENLSVNSENLSASRSRIMDADFAAETANLSRTQILQQAGTAMVAQANQLPQQVLKLLQG